MKVLQFRTKSALFGYFWTGIWKYCCHIWNLCPRTCTIANFRAKMKLFKFGTKDALFAYFLAALFKKLLSYLKSTPSRFSKIKILCKNENLLNIGSKIPYFDMFGLEFEEGIAIFETTIFINAKLCVKKENP